MIRFVDMRKVYWLPPAPRPRPRRTRGPFAFIDTIRDTFVDVGGHTVFDSFDVLVALIAADLAAGRMGAGRAWSICRLVPEALR
jgi:hypothetical protein